MPCSDCPDPKFSACRHLGFCTKKRFAAVSSADLNQSNIVSAIRQTTYELTANENVRPSGVRAWLCDKLWQQKVQSVDQFMRPLEPDLDYFEPTDEDIDNDRADIFDEQLREFFRVNACAAPRNIHSAFVTERWHPQFKCMATVVGVSHPERARWWPRVIRGQYIDPRVANDNRPPEPQD
ncbi:MAG: hypothetical protein AAGG69_06740 [Pseudomonadota bacterium]